MNNFRGFSETLIPLTQTNFLVGENSTGKSSFLSVLYLAAQPSFWFYPELTLSRESQFGGFSDIVSAWGSDKSMFQVGVVATEENKSGKIEMSFSIHTFGKKDDTPRLERHSALIGKRASTLVFGSTTTKYKTIDCHASFDSESDALEEFRRFMSLERSCSTGFKTFPKDVLANPPLPMAMSILESLERGESHEKFEFRTNVPMAINIAWVAPIRTKPKRFYDGMSLAYSPEGEHVPLLLRKNLRSKTKSKKFADRLAAFGDSSGLFETVAAHSFGKGTRSPFELLIQFKGAALNINNVGYGVSQALPLVVEFLNAEGKKTFAVQQPEVHLHPRAQAALGGLVFELAREREHSFFIETHSDYLIDRYRLSMRDYKAPPRAQILFFVRTSNGNSVHVLPISKEGLYPTEQPKGFRDFFIKEEMRLLNI